MKIELRNWVVAVLLVAIALIAAAAIPTAMQQRLHEDLQTTASVILPLMIIAGILGFLGVFAVVALAFTAVNLSDRSQALGLPEGTVRAVIALSLIFIFLIAALYLYADLRLYGRGKVYTSTGIPKEMVNRWEADDIVSIQATQVTTDTTLYDVERRAAGQSEASEDFAAQILTTVSTLVVAIAGFYFGTRAVAVARDVEEAPLPSIEKYTFNPLEGTQGGEVTFDISGKNFRLPKVKLVSGSKEMLAIDDPPPMWSATKISGKFKIAADAQVGKWSLVVVNEDGGQDWVKDAFTVTAST